MSPMLIGGLVIGLVAIVGGAVLFFGSADSTEAVTATDVIPGTESSATAGVASESQESPSETLTNASGTDAMAPADSGASAVTPEVAAEQSQASSGGTTNANAESVGPSVDPHVYTKGGGRRADDPAPGILPEAARGDGSVELVISGVSGGTSVADYLWARVREMAGNPRTSGGRSLRSGTLTIQQGNVSDAAALAKLIDFGQVSSVSNGRIDIVLQPDRLPAELPPIPGGSKSIPGVDLNALQNPGSDAQASDPTAQEIAHVLINLTHWDSSRRETAVKWLKANFRKIPETEQMSVVSAIQIRTEDVASSVSTAATQALTGLPSPLPADGARVIVTNGPTGTAEQLQLAMRLRELPGVTHVKSSSSDQSTTFILHPVISLQALSDAIDFGAVTRIDEAGRTLYVNAVGQSAEVSPSGSAPDMTSPAAASGSTVRLEQKSLLNGRLKMLVPFGFALMDEQILAAKYPSGNRPTEVYTDASTKVNIAVNHTQNALQEPQLAAFHQQMDQMFRGQHPGSEWFRSGPVKINDRVWFTLDFRMQAADTKIRNIMMMTSLDNRLLIVSVNVTADLEATWMKPAQQMLDSMMIR